MAFDFFFTFLQAQMNHPPSLFVGRSYICTYASVFQGSTKCWKASDADECPQKERDGEMRSQLAMHDTAGMTLGA